MIDAIRRKKILARGRSSAGWEGEPRLGGWYTEREINAVVKSIRDSMDWRKGFGFITKEITGFEKSYARYVGAKYAVSVATASIGLDMAMRCLELRPGDEVICPAINFKASHMAILGSGGKIVLCEVNPRTFNADPADVERRITRRTRAILPVHMNGLSAPMAELIAVARRHSRPGRPIRVIGDAARAGGGGYRGGKIGKLGWMTVFSFHTMKLMTTLGEGGMITTDDPKVAKRLEDMRQWGGKHGWGSSYKMTHVQAAVGAVQLKRLDSMIARRVRLARLRSRMLEGIPELTLPFEPKDCEHTYYLYTLLVPGSWAGRKRDMLIDILRRKYGVGCMIGNPPVYWDSGLIAKSTKGQRLPLAESLGKRLFCPSIHPLMTDRQNEYIAAAVIEAVNKVGRAG
jgi:dTDP-4-amino-4,6-dideoxygalactose transaminase